MSTENIIYGQEYSRNIMQLAQQEESLLYRYTYMKGNIGGKNAYQDRIGEWRMVPKVGRNPETPSFDPNLSRRQLVLEDVHGAVLLDKSDNVRILSDPLSEYTMSGAQTLGRNMDANIIKNTLGIARGGENGETSIGFPTEQIIPDGGTGLTFEKIRRTTRLFNRANVKPADRFFVASPDGIADLLNEDQVTNSDYASINAIQNGGFDGQTWMGFKWIMIADSETSTLLPKTGNVRQNFAFHKYGICTGMGFGPNVRIDERTDKSYATQVYFDLSMATTRLEEVRVVRVDAVESATP